MRKHTHGLLRLYLLLTVLLVGHARIACGEDGLAAAAIRTMDARFRSNNEMIGRMCGGYSKVA